MMAPGSNEVTQLLERWSGGDRAALDELIPIVYDELRKMARRCMNGQGVGHTMQTTELIHEAYLRLAPSHDKDWKSRSHFFGVAAQAMRHILVDHARSKNRLRRGGPQQRVTLTDQTAVLDTRSDEILALEDALMRLFKLDERKGRIVEMKFFGGLNFEEIAEVMQISVITIKRDWSFSKNWLSREISQS